MRKIAIKTLIVLQLLLSQGCSSVPGADENQALAAALEELRATQAEIQDLNTNNNDLLIRFDKKQAEIAALKSQLSAQDGKNSEYSILNRDLTTELASRQHELLELRADLKSVRAQESLYEEKLASAIATANQASASLAATEGEYAELIDRSKSLVDEARESVRNNGHDKLLNASVVFNTPKKMHVGESIEISLLVAVEKAIDDTIQEFIEDYHGLDPEVTAIHAHSAMLGQVVVASLRASGGLTVRSMTGAGDDADGRKLDIDNPENNKWSWEVSADKEGDQWVRVSLYYERKNQDGVNESRSFGTWRSRPIEVNVKSADSFSAFIDKYIMPNIEFLWMAILMPLAAFAGAQWKQRRSS